MTDLRRVVVTMALALGFFGSPTPAFADDPVCREETDECVIVVNVEDKAAAQPPKGETKDSPPAKTVPQCSAFSGGTVVLPGTPSGDIPEADRPQPGWIRITCLEAGEQMWLWMDPGANAETIARTLLARLQLEPIRMGWTPLRDGALGIVGAPTWLWVEDPGRDTWGPATITAGGVSLTAKVESITWSMGNGDVVRCANRGTPWRMNMGAGPSPTCGYVYEEQGTYQVTATAHWVARWSGYGRSGQIPLSLSQERTLEVGEIQVILTR